jgi:outer membrane receptor protein involved in Fe transport
MFSFGDWYYEGNSKNIPLYNFQQQVVTVNDYYLDGVKVGNAAQLTAFFKLQYNITNQWRVFASQFYADKLFAKIDVGSFSTPNHKGSLELPAYSLVDAGTTYRFKVKNFGSVNLRFSVQNLFDKHYISESDTNIFPDANSNTWHGVNTQNRVFFGWGRTWQFGVDIKL